MRFRPLLPRVALSIHLAPGLGAGASGVRETFYNGPHTHRSRISLRWVVWAATCCGLRWSTAQAAQRSADSRDSQRTRTNAKPSTGRGFACRRTNARGVFQSAAARIFRSLYLLRNHQLEPYATYSICPPQDFSELVASGAPQRRMPRTLDCDPWCLIRVWNCFSGCNELAATSGAGIAGVSIGSCEL